MMLLCATTNSEFIFHEEQVNDVIKSSFLCDEEE